MIIGIGNDITDIRRIERSLERFGERFTHRCFTDVERYKSDKQPTFALRAASYAKRYAAKEACAKALGTGIMQGVFFKDIGVVNLDTGQPTLILTGGALERVEKILPSEAMYRAHLTLTDEPPYAQAHVIIEAIAHTL